MCVCCCCYVVELPDELRTRGERLRAATERVSALEQELAATKANTLPLQLQIERANLEKQRFEEQAKWLQSLVDEKVRVKFVWLSRPPLANDTPPHTHTVAFAINRITLR